MKTNRTTNQLGLAPMRMPNTRTSWIERPPPSMRGSWQGGVSGARGRSALRRRGVWRAMIACASTPAGSVPYCSPASPARRDGAERVGDRGRRVAHEQRALQRERHPLDDAARARLDRLGVGELVAQRARRTRRGARRRRPPRRPRRGTPRSASGARPARAARRGHDVARALPDRRQRHLAVQARHARLLDVAVAAEALERLERVAGAALADPVLRRPRSRGA